MWVPLWYNIVQLTIGAICLICSTTTIGLAFLPEWSKCDKTYMLSAGIAGSVTSMLFITYQIIVNFVELKTVRRANGLNYIFTFMLLLAMLVVAMLLFRVNYCISHGLLIAIGVVIGIIVVTALPFIIPLYIFKNEGMIKMAYGE